jgi:hypothetical protein
MLNTRVLHTFFIVSPRSLVGCEEQNGMRESLVMQADEIGSTNRQTTVSRPTILPYSGDSPQSRKPPRLQTAAEMMSFLQLR